MKEDPIYFSLEHHSLELVNVAQLYWQQESCVTKARTELSWGFCGGLVGLGFVCFFFWFFFLDTREIRLGLQEGEVAEEVIWKLELARFVACKAKL